MNGRTKVRIGDRGKEEITKKDRMKIKIKFKEDGRKLQRN